MLYMAMQRYAEFSLLTHFDLLYTNDENNIQLLLYHLLMMDIIHLLIELKVN